MRMPFKQMYTQIGQFIQDSSSGRQTRIKDAINRNYFEVAEGYDWKDLYEVDVAEVTSFANESYVFMPSHVDLVKVIILDSNNELLLIQDPGTFLERHHDSLDSFGTTYSFTPVGYSPVKRVISSAETLTLVSSDASDTSQAVQIWGISSGEEINESLTLNGTSSVTTTNSFTRITRIGTDSYTGDSSRSGHITITGTTSSTEYAVIKNSEFTSVYQAIRLQDGPSSNTTLTIFYKKRVQQLINDGDTLEIYGDKVVFELAVADILRQQAKYNQARDHEAKANDALNKAMSRLMTQTGVTFQSRPIGPGNGRNSSLSLFDKRVSVQS